MQAFFSSFKPGSETKHGINSYPLKTLRRWCWLLTLEATGRWKYAVLVGNLQQKNLSLLPSVTEQWQSILCKTGSAKYKPINDNGLYIPIILHISPTKNTQSHTLRWQSKALQNRHMLLCANIQTCALVWHSSYVWQTCEATCNIYTLK